MQRSKNYRRTNNGLSYKNLEQRLYLTVAGNVNDANMLWVTGSSDGDVAIVAGEDGYTLTDNGTEVGTFTDVERLGIYIDAGRDNDTANNVSVDFGSETVDFVFAYAGNGENNFIFAGEETIGAAIVFGGNDNDIVDLNVATDGMATMILRGGDDSFNLNADANWVSFRAGSDNDTFTMPEDVTADGKVWVSLGSGENAATIDGSAQRLTVAGGHETDSVTIGATASFERNVHLNLGNGENKTSFAGTTNGGLFVNGGQEADNVTVAEGATVANNTTLKLGNGDNVATLDGVFGDSIRVYAGAGSDQVTFGSNSAITGSVLTNLGDGDNSFSLAGSVSEDLTVYSQNADDVFEVTGEVSGETTLGPGDQVMNRGRGFKGRFGGFWSWFSRGFGRRR